jgi:Xaa-Pro dipeptidase
VNTPDPTAPDRSADIDLKQQEAAVLLTQMGCEGLLLLAPANFSRFTAGAVPPAALDPGDRPAVYFSGQQRWVLCSNVDTQALFDEQLDGLGFQLKEWNWQRGRETLLAEVCQGRAVAADLPLGECLPAAEPLARLRRRLTPWERAEYRRLGADLAHALEATCRNLEPGETERQVAGQLAHRLVQRGVTPEAIAVAADDRARRYRRHGVTPTVITRMCMLEATASRHGLFVTASRSVCFGEPDERFRAEFDAASRAGVVWLAGSKPGVVPAEVIGLASVMLPRGSDFEHEWKLSPPGIVTGYRPVEAWLTPRTLETFQEGSAVAWQARVGAARLCDTALVGGEGPIDVTPAEEGWPVRRLKLQGAAYDRPDVLIREVGG